MKRFLMIILGLSLLGAGTAENEFDFSKLVKARNALKQTVSKLTFTNDEIKEALWRGKFLFFDVTDLKKPIEDITEEFKFKSLTLEGKNSPNLVTLTLDGEVSYPKLGKIPLIFAPNAGIVDISGDSREFVVKVFGVKYDNKKIQEFHWRNREDLSIILADQTEVPLNTEEIEFFKKNDERWKAFREKNDRENLVPYQVAVDVFAFFERFMTSAKDNLIQIPLVQNSVYYDEVQKFIARLAREKDQAPSKIMENMRQVVISPEMIVVDFNNEREVTTKRGYLKIDKQVKIKSRTKTAMVILGLAGANEEKEWFPVSNAILLDPNEKDFPYGAIRLTVRSLGPIGAKRPTHQYIEFEERFKELGDEAP